MKHNMNDVAKRAINMREIINESESKRARVELDEPTRIGRVYICARHSDGRLDSPTRCITFRLNHRDEIEKTDTYRL